MLIGYCSDRGIGQDFILANDTVSLYVSDYHD